MSTSFVDSIHDPIWGDIPITKLEQDIIRTKAFKRLRNIKQMSLAYLKFHGAHHTRYEHSIGCMHVAYNLLITLKGDEAIKTELKQNDQDPENAEIIKYIRLAALLHDIGHAPMSHLVESAFHKYPELFNNIVTQNNINEFTDKQREILSNKENYSHEAFSVSKLYDDSELKELFRSSSIQPDILAYLINNAGQPLERFNIYKPIISGDLDADRLDYINRDFYYCGFKEFVDLQLFSKSLRLERNKKNTKIDIVIDESSVIDASDFLFARYKLSQKVHNAHESRLNEQAFLEIIRHYFTNMSDEDRGRKIVQLHTEADDSDLVSELKSAGIELGGRNKTSDIGGSTQTNNSAKRLTVSTIIHGESEKYLRDFFSLRLDSFHPIERFYLYFIANDMSRLVNLEENIRKIAKIEDNFIIDIVNVKPSEMNLPVIRRKGDQRTLFDDYGFPHAIYAASLSSLEIRYFLYNDVSLNEYAIAVKKRVHDLKITECKETFLCEKLNRDGTHNAIVRTVLAVKDAIIDTMEGHYKVIDFASYPLDLKILAIMSTVKDYVRSKDEFNYNGEVWLEGDTATRDFISSVIDEMENPSSFSLNESKRIDMNVYYKACERLVLYGLVKHIHVPIPANFMSIHDENGPPHTVFARRVERMINTWGSRLISRLRDTSDEKEKFEKNYQIIQRIVFQRQRKVRHLFDELRQIFSRKKDSVYDEIASERSFEIKKKIKENGGCLFKLR